LLRFDHPITGPLPVRREVERFWRAAEHRAEAAEHRAEAAEQALHDLRRELGRGQGQ
jgi:hypothetical protein